MEGAAADGTAGREGTPAIPGASGDPAAAGIRCGIDLVSVERIARIGRELDGEGLASIFAEGEISACREARFPERGLAERFAAKEACLKLFPDETAAGELGIEDVVTAGRGPDVRVDPGPRLRAAMERRGIAGICLSVASCRSQAVAMAVARAGDPREEALRRAVEAVRALRPTLVGRAARRLVPIRRSVILANMRRVFGDRLAEAEYRHLMDSFYAHMARFLAETAASTFRSRKGLARRVRVERMEVPLREAGKGKGLIILTGHVGSWEMACAAGILRFPQYRDKFHFLRRPISSRLVETLVLRRFRRVGLRVIPKKHSLFDILGLLERNEALVFILDQHAAVPKDGIPVEFFGEPAGTFRSLALIAKASGAPVIPAHCWREEGGGHVLRFEDPIPWIPRPDHEGELRENTRAYNRALEDMILQHPEQWFWMHKRWKLGMTRPESRRRRRSRRR